MHVTRALVLSAVITGLLASSAQAGFGCSASAGRLTVLGKTVEPVTANTSGVECKADVKTLSGDALKLPTPLSGGALVAATEFYPVQKSILASGGVADLRVKSLPDLPIALPKVTIPAALRDTLNGVLGSIDLSTVKDAIPVLPTNLVTNLTTTLKTDYVIGQTGLLNGVLTLLLTPAQVEEINADNLATNTANAATNADNLATNTANATVNAIRDAIPSTIAVDDDILASLLTNLQLPDVDLLRIQGAMAYAAASCQSGTAGVSGTSKVAGITVLGQELPVDQALDLVRTLLASAPLDPTNLSVSADDLGLTSDQIALINAAAWPQLKTMLDGVTSTLQGVLDGAGLMLPEVLVQIKVTPGQQVRTADSVTQQALNISVAIAGQQIAAAVLGEAKVSAAGVDCAAPVVDPNTPAGQVLTCEGRSLVLTDVFQKGRRVKLLGIADPALSGQTVSFVLDATGKVVARTKVTDDGTFDTTAPLPRKSIRETDLARYQASIGKERSSNLKLRRRFVLKSLTSENRKVTFRGRLIGPLGKPVKPIELRRRVSCTETKLVTKFKPRMNGHFRITIKAPKNVGTAVYTMKTVVRSSAGGSGLFETYMLPRAIQLKK